MQIHKGTFVPGDLLTLRLLEGVERHELMELLASDGIQFEVVEADKGTVALVIRTPRQLMVLKEAAG
ncbi:hypothetical protein ACWKWZ_11505 [Metapseudomonas otitidis]